MVQVQAQAQVPAHAYAQVQTQDQAQAQGEEEGGGGVVWRGVGFIGGWDGFGAGDAGWGSEASTGVPRS